MPSGSVGFLVVYKLFVYASSSSFTFLKASLEHATLNTGGWLTLPDRDFHSARYCQLLGAHRGRLADYSNEPLTDPGVRNYRTGLFCYIRVLPKAK